MCGGIVWNLKKTPTNELKKYYTPDQIKYFKKKGMISSFFWDKRPILPVEDEKKIQLFDWGNRDKNTAFPQTGWAKEESVNSGKWKWLKPKKVKIPVQKGYEKKVWFDFKDGTEGILVEKDGIRRVYMLTKKADKKYLFNTHHDRMPPGNKINFKKIIKRNSKNE